MSWLSCGRAADDWLAVRVLRDGVVTNLKYQLNLRRPLVPVLAGVDCVPSYFIVGGLVFVPLSIPFLEHAYGGAPPAVSRVGSKGSLPHHRQPCVRAPLHPLPGACLRRCAATAPCCVQMGLWRLPLRSGSSTLADCGAETRGLGACQDVRSHGAPCCSVMHGVRVKCCSQCYPKLGFEAPSITSQSEPLQCSWSSPAGPGF